MVQGKISSKISQLSYSIYGRKTRSFSERLYVYISLIKNLKTGLFRVVNGKIRLRNCASTGKLITVRGPLRVEGSGKITVGDHCKIWSHMGVTQLFADRGAELIIGEGTFINTACIVSASNRIVIGKNCQIANQVIIMDGDFHGVDDRDAPGKSDAIIIGDNAWLATRSMILKGVEIGEGATVAAGSVVTKNVAPYTLVGGVPAKLIRNLEVPNQNQDKPA
ncbi:acyltransferase [uncultured Cyclobacterium sp.]|uniref:acyltransferase n=1 Tax=uncultured Cyclobacterium sp. TaxID=453820 RepID=UPI0030ED6C40|tara:strand:+ start:143875 stop:144537 length:663 start_codon:yes stop_codon:yes gene_type:complete